MNAEAQVMLKIGGDLTINQRRSGELDPDEMPESTTTDFLTVAPFELQEIAEAVSEPIEDRYFEQAPEENFTAQRIGLREFIDKMFGRLSELQAERIRLMYGYDSDDGEPMTMSAVGRLQGVSANRISQHHHDGMKRLLDLANWRYDELIELMKDSPLGIVHTPEQHEERKTFRAPLDGHFTRSHQPPTTKRVFDEYVPPIKRLVSTSTGGSAQSESTGSTGIAPEITSNYGDEEPNLMPSNRSFRVNSSGVVREYDHEGKEVKQAVRSKIRRMFRRRSDTT